MLHWRDSFMTRSAVQALRTPQERTIDTLRQVALIVGASLYVALCAHITIPLMPLTPVPLTVQNLAVLLVGLMLGSRRGFAALMLYLFEGIAGLPVFSPNPTGLVGVAHLFGVTGGFLLAYPLVAFVAGFVFEHGKKSFARAAIAGILVTARIGGRFLIDGEPTDNRLAKATKGAVRLELFAEGRMAHSAYPELGESAIEKLLDSLEPCPPHSAAAR